MQTATNNRSRGAVDKKMKKMKEEGRRDGE